MASKKIKKVLKKVKKVAKVIAPVAAIAGLAIGIPAGVTAIAGLVKTVKPVVKAAKTVLPKPVPQLQPKIDEGAIIRKEWELYVSANFDNETYMYLLDTGFFDMVQSEKIPVS